MKVYIAGRFTGRERLARRAEDLKRVDPKVKILSSWLTPRTEAEHKDYPYDEAEARVYAMRDLDELWLADVLILDTIDDSNTGGREVELGYALGRVNQVIIAGPRRNVFHYLADLQYDNWSDLLLDWSRLAS